MATRSSGPIFLGGVDRSGIGLLREVLNTHPEIHLSRRTRFWSLVADRFGDLSHPPNAERAIEAMSDHPRLAELGIERERLLAELRRRDAHVTYGDLFELVHRHHLDRIGKSRWGDKSLDAEMHADRIFREYPTAVMIHLIRDPRDRYASHATHRRVPSGRVGSGTALWSWSASLAERNRARYPDRYRVVRYEDLVTRPRSTVEGVCEFLDVPFEPSMLRSFPMPPSHRRRPDDPPRDHGFSPISIGRYSRDLTRREIAFIQLLAGRRMQHFGYPIAEVDLTGVERVWFVLLDVPLNTARLLAWHMKRRLVDEGRGRLRPPTLPGRRRKETPRAGTLSTEAE